MTQAIRWLAPIVIAGCFHETPQPPPAPVVAAPLRCKREQLSQTPAERMVVDVHDIYVASYMGSLTRIPIHAGPETTFATDRNVMRLAIDDSYVYWSSLSGDRSVKRRPKAGGPIEIVASHQADPEYIAVDESAVYWSTVNGGAVMKWDKTSHQTSRFASGSGAIALDRGNVYWGRARDGDHYGPTAIGRKSKAGGDPALVTPYMMAEGIATDGIDIYWTNAYGTDVQRVPLGDRAAAETFSIGTAIDDSPEPHSRDISVDATHVYWEQDRVLLRRAKRGGVVEVVVPGEPTIDAFAVTPDTIYWGTTHGVFRMKRAPCGL